MPPDTISAEGRKDDAYLALLGDIYAHLGETDRAEEIFRDAIAAIPTTIRRYLSLALLAISRPATLTGAKEDTPSRGKPAFPLRERFSGDWESLRFSKEILRKRRQQFERAVEMLPEWPGSYSTLGVFYFQTGQIAKAKEVLSRFKNSSANSVLDVNRIEQVLAQAPETNSAANQPMTMAEQGADAATRTLARR